jgi:hypothetical protein
MPLTQVPPGLHRFPLRHAQPGIPFAHETGEHTPAWHVSPALQAAPAPQTHPAVPTAHSIAAEVGATLDSLLLPQPVSAVSAHASRSDHIIRM